MPVCLGHAAHLSLICLSLGSRALASCTTTCVVQPHEHDFHISDVSREGRGEREKQQQQQQQAGGGGGLAGWGEQIIAAKRDKWGTKRRQRGDLVQTTYESLGHLVRHVVLLVDCRGLGSSSRGTRLRTRIGTAPVKPNPPKHHVTDISEAQFASVHA
jgi:hypothetical protein